MFGIEINSCNNSSFTFQKDLVCIFGRIMSCWIFLLKRNYFSSSTRLDMVSFFVIGMSQVIKNSLSARCYKLLLKLNNLCSCKGLRKNCKMYNALNFSDHLVNYHQIYFPKIDQNIKWVNCYIWTPFMSCKHLR